MGERRYLVRIRCKQCGERFVLKGSMKKGKLDTGFKQCLCENNDPAGFEITSERL
ncbi:hypothetical protein C8P63_11023 [Melghirimyces profundicolus]|uniref:Uncharacterized protein n=1 Tax=Melghirimyces profundicolus TaxID=1242148 RepID=A0A2T6BUW9_9BACL|nr:hypothetical protein C8P63_11023 [Melghirimyces profundicolus]